MASLVRQSSYFLSIASTRSHSSKPLMIKSLISRTRQIAALSPFTAQACNNNNIILKNNIGRSDAVQVMSHGAPSVLMLSKKMSTRSNPVTSCTPPNPNPISFRTNPSPLSLLPQDFRPGQAQQLIQEKGKGKRLLRRTEVRDLFLSAREGYPKDARCILHTLKVIRRCNAHYIKDWQAQAAIQGMIRAWTPIQRVSEEKCAAWTLTDASHNSADFCKARLQAANYVYKAILDDTTGLITSVSIYDVEELLFKDTVLKALEAKNLDDDLLKLEVLSLTKRVFHKLIFRASRPDRFLSKKQAAKYRKKVWTDTPPSPQTTHLAAQICLLAGKSDDAQIAIVKEYIRMRAALPLQHETLALIQVAKEKEEQCNSHHPLAFSEEQSLVPDVETNLSNTDELLKVDSIELNANVDDRAIKPVA